MQFGWGTTNLHRSKARKTQALQQNCGAPLRCLPVSPAMLRCAGLRQSLLSRWRSGDEGLDVPRRVCRTPANPIVRCESGGGTTEGHWLQLHAQIQWRYGASTA